MSDPTPVTVTSLAPHEEVLDVIHAQASVAVDALRRADYTATVSTFSELGNGLDIFAYPDLMVEQVFAISFLSRVQLHHLLPFFVYVYRKVQRPSKEASLLHRVLPFLFEYGELARNLPTASISNLFEMFYEMFTREVVEITAKSPMEILLSDINMGFKDIERLERIIKVLAQLYRRAKVACLEVKITFMDRKGKLPAHLNAWQSGLIYIWQNAILNQTFGMGFPIKDFVSCAFVGYYRFLLSDTKRSFEQLRLSDDLLHDPEDPERSLLQSQERKRVFDVMSSAGRNGFAYRRRYVCVGCGRFDDKAKFSRAFVSCRGCSVATYCSKACGLAASTNHGPECGNLGSASGALDNAALTYTSSSSTQPQT